jgi:hypothetical protein
MGHANTPPQIPEVTDEAGDSPKWLPALGLGLFALLVGCILWCHMPHGESAAAAPGAAEAPAEAAK